MGKKSLTIAPRKTVSHLEYSENATLQLYWEDYFVQIDEIQAEIQRWLQLRSKTPTDQQIRDSNLKTLREELEVFLNYQELLTSQYRSSNFVGPLPSTIPATTWADGETQLLNSLEVLKFLNIAPYELAQFVRWGPENGGIRAFYKEEPGWFKEPGRLVRFSYDNVTGRNYLKPLETCWFIDLEIASFRLLDRFITGASLLKIWQRHLKSLDQTTSFIRSVVFESRLWDLHPTEEYTVASSMSGGGTEAGEDEPPPIEEGLFPLSHVKEIQESDLRLCYPIPTTNRNEPPAQRKVKYEALYQENRESLGTHHGALKATADQIGISAVRLGQILGRYQK